MHDKTRMNQYMLMHSHFYYWK